MPALWINFALKNIHCLSTVKSSVFCTSCDNPAIALDVPCEIVPIPGKKGRSVGAMSYSPNASQWYCKTHLPIRMSETIRKEGDLKNIESARARKTVRTLLQRANFI